MRLTGFLFIAHYYIITHMREIGTMHTKSTLSSDNTKLFRCIKSPNDSKRILMLSFAG